MYINEVLYHIDEDYKKWCDTIDMVCEELLLEQKDDWFFNMTPDEQDKYLKDHPNSAKAKELKKKRDSMPQKDVDIKDNIYIIKSEISDKKSSANLYWKVI